MTELAPAAQTVKLAGQRYNQNTVSKCAARAQQPVGLGRSSGKRSRVELEPLACSREKSSEVERNLARALDLHNARSANKLEDRSVACTVFARRRVGMRTGLSQLVATCALAMLLLARPHGAEGRFITACCALVITCEIACTHCHASAACEDRLFCFVIRASLS